MMGERNSARDGAFSRRFELRAKVGEGGMGIVYRAWDRTLGKEVALKRVREVDPARARQLKSEFRARSALQHKNLVQLFELVIDDDDCFLTMELVHGTDLTSWVRGGTSSAPAEETPITAETVREGPNARTVSMATLLRPPTLIPRSSARYLGMPPTLACAGRMPAGLRRERHGRKSACSGFVSLLPVCLWPRRRN